MKVVTKNKKEIRMSPKHILPLLALAGISYASRAEAQTLLDTNPPLQNVMLLVDTSGSMEFATDGTKVTCDRKDVALTSEPATVATALAQKNRWFQLVEVLTGDVTDPGCYTQDRTSTRSRTSTSSRRG